MGVLYAASMTMILQQALHSLQSVAKGLAATKGLTCNIEDVNNQLKGADPGECLSKQAGQ